MIEIASLTIALTLGISVSLIVILYKHLEAKVMSKIIEYYRSLEDRLYNEISMLRYSLDQQNKRINVVNKGLKFSLETQNRILSILLSRKTYGYKERMSSTEYSSEVIGAGGSTATAKYVHSVNLEKLNDTERSVLVFLSNAGRKVGVREIQLHMNKSREHIARLMKKLYEDGYVERESRGNSYVYWVRDEVKGIIAGDTSTS